MSIKFKAISAIAAAALIALPATMCGCTQSTATPTTASTAQPQTLSEITKGLSDETKVVSEFGKDIDSDQVLAEMRDNTTYTMTDDYAPEGQNPEDTYMFLNGDYVETYELAIYDDGGIKKGILSISGTVDTTTYELTTKE